MRVQMRFVGITRWFDIISISHASNVTRHLDFLVERVIDNVSPVIKRHVVTGVNIKEVVALVGPYRYEFEDVIVASYRYVGGEPSAEAFRLNVQTFRGSWARLKVRPKSL